MTKSYYLNYKEFLMNKSFTKIDIEKIELVESILKKKILMVILYISMVMVEVLVLLLIFQLI